MWLLNIYSSFSGSFSFTCTVGQLGINGKLFSLLVIFYLNASWKLSSMLHQHFSRKPIPVVNHLHSKDFFFLICGLSLSWYSFVLFPHMWPSVPRSRTWYLSLLSPVRELQQAMRSSFSFSSLDWTAQVSSASPHRTCLPALLPDFTALLWMLSKTLTSFLYCKALNCAQYLRQGCTNAKYRRRITSLPDGYI